MHYYGSPCMKSRNCIWSKPEQGTSRWLYCCQLKKIMINCIIWNIFSTSYYYFSMQLSVGFITFHFLLRWLFITFIMHKLPSICIILTMTCISRNKKQPPSKAYFLVSSLESKNDFKRKLCFFHMENSYHKICDLPFILNDDRSTILLILVWD